MGITTKKLIAANLLVWTAVAVGQVTNPYKYEMSETQVLKLRVAQLEAQDAFQRSQVAKTEAETMLRRLLSLCTQVKTELKLPDDAVCNINELPITFSEPKKQAAQPTTPPTK